MTDFSDIKNLRGDYSRAGPDFVVDQQWQTYDAGQHALWQRLYQRQGVLVPSCACAEYLAALSRLDISQGIPRFDDLNARLRRTTSWEIVPVPGLVPDDVFFTHLAARRFPATIWLREEREFDYIVEPDVFHDVFGHVPLLFDGAYADYLQAFGQGGLRALEHHALPWLARLYWFTIEFGLIRAGGALKVYGAGLLSSGSEMRHAIEATAPRRLEFDLMRVMQTPYDIDRFQDTYFIIDGFARLREQTAVDFAPLYERLSVAAPYQS